MLLWRTLLAILFPAPSLARWTQRVLAWLRRIDALLGDPETVADLQTSEGRLKLESQLALGEDWINFLINARAAEHLGHRYTYHDRQGRFWAPAAPRSWASLMQRYNRMRASLANIERLARRRANRIRREIEANPLSLPAAMMMIGDQYSDRAIIIMREVLPRRRRGRWIGASSRRDGGGRATARGPPPTALDCRLPIPDCPRSLSF